MTSAGEGASAPSLFFLFALDGFGWRWLVRVLLGLFYGEKAGVRFLLVVGSAVCAAGSERPGPMPGGWSYGGGRGGNSAGALASTGGEELVVVHNKETSRAAGRILGELALSK